MISMNKPPKSQYADTFIFLKSYLNFSPNGLPTDPSTQSYYKRRIQAEHSAEMISFSVFLYAVWHCFKPVIESIRLYRLDQTYQPEWILAFWQEVPTILLNPVAPTQGKNPRFSCEVFDLRGCRYPLAHALARLPKNLPTQAAVLLITDDLVSDTPLIQPTPFGVVSFFDQQQWEAYCENPVSASE